MKGYPGAKGGAGIAQRIISLMPAHALYIEPFAVIAVIGRIKRPSALEVYIDRDR